MEALARRVLEAAPPRFALAGLSMGGIVAMEVIRQAPERVTRLALLDTNPLAEPPERGRLRDGQIARVMDGALTEVMRDEMKPHYLADGPGKAALLDLCMQMALALGPQAFAEQSEALRSRPDQSATLRGVRVPALVLCGAEDRLCPLSRHELMAGLIPGARLVVVPEAGHLPTLEQPARTTAALADWLAA